jgi:hypothetical protein
MKWLEFSDDHQSQMSDSEVITFAILAAKFFSGNYKIARYFCKQLKMFPNILSNSRLNRRIHHITWDCWYAIFNFLSLIFKEDSDTCYFAVDSLPIAYCQKNRIDKRKRFLGSEYLGFSASKKRYFCGIKVHMIVTNQGKPIELRLRPGSKSDVTVLWSMQLDIPAHSIVYADGAYNCFDLEDVLQDEHIYLRAKRGSKGKNRLRSITEEKEINSKRQIVETAFSSITSILPRYIKARTEKGFLIKIICFILAYGASFLAKNPLM